MTDEQAYEAWLRAVPPEITTDTIWRMTAYRFSLFLSFQAQADLRFILRHRDTRPHADQLLRAIGGISASLDEGYSRSSGKERAHFYEYALGSAREGRGWYYKCSIALPNEVATARLVRLSRVVRILTVVVPRERAANKMLRPRTPPPNEYTLPDHPAATSSS
jgi:four helix bundle protein